MADFDTNDCTSLYSIKGIVILDQDGNRIIAKYYDKNNFGTAKEQKAFEKSLFQKTHRNSSSEILLLDGVTCVYRSNVDLHFYVLGSSRENELVLESLLNCFYDAISTVLRKNVEKKTLIDSMDTCILILDEICDEGIILETDPTAVISRCALRGDEVYFSDQSFSQVGKSFMESAKEQIKWSLLKMRRLTIHKSPARSHVEKAAKPVLEGKENDAFTDETEVLRRSAAENYFMQGKCGIMNKYRKGRRKITTHAEEDSSSDDEENDSAGIMAKFSLESLSKFVEETSKEKAKNLEKIKENFSYWTNVYLESEFNICIIGAGAKNAVLNSYERQLASDGECTFLVEGFNEEASIRGILQSLSDALKIKKTPRDIVNWAREITKHLEKKESRVFMFLHNIDASNLRDSADQKALAVMSSTPWLRLVTTVDHLNATLMWDSFCSKKFNFVFVEVNTFDFSLSNLMASKSRILGLDPKHNASTHTMSSLDILWQSLAENARKIFRIFFAMHYETGQSVPFWDLFNTARDDFLVSSDAALRLLLVEFEDHRVLTRRRREDGNENLIPCLDRDLVEKFLTEKGISLEL